jgi:hypothetical protein
MKKIVLTLALASAVAAPCYAKSVKPMSSDANILRTDRGRVGETPSFSYGYERNDPWGHWGAYYGPLVH